MRSDNTINMDLNDNNSSFDSEAEDLEIRMYSELYFEPNPDYVPLPPLNDKDSIMQPRCTFKSVPPVCDVNNSKDLPSGSSHLVEKLTSPVNNITSPTSSKQAHVSSNVNASIIEKKQGFADESDACASHVIKPTKSIAPKPVKPSKKKIGNQPGKELVDLIVIDDSSSETNNNSIQVRQKKKKLIEANSTSQKNSSSPFKHEVQGQTGKRQSTLSDFITKLKSTSALKNSRKCQASAAKKMENKRGSRYPTEFLADISSESDPEITKFGINSTLLTNLSINRGESLNNSAMERVYGVTAVGEQKEGEKPSKKRRRSTRTHWPTDYTTDKSLGDRVPPLPHWTPHMTAFYDTDFSDEFDLDDIHKRMPSSVVEWDLEEDDLPYSVLRRHQNDRKSTPRQRQRYFKSNTRCERCRSFDHSTVQCTKLEYCHLCGNTGHSGRDSCPSNTCLRCGDGIHTFCQRATVWSRCDICNRKGHIQDLCPDVWRRFCYTTSGTTPITPSNNPASSVAPDRISCFSCGKSGHLGPDCQHRVPNYVVLSYDVMSYDQPTQNLLGMNVLKPVKEPAWHMEEEVEIYSQYGENVTVYTPSRASILLPDGMAGMVVGKAGVVIKTLQRVSSCTLSVSNKDGEQDVLWVTGESIDLVIRAVLFYFLKVPTDIDGLDVYSSALEDATGHGFYQKAYRKEVARLRAEYSRQKLYEKQDKQSLNNKNAKKLKRSLAENANGKGHEITNGCDDVVYISDSNESDIEVLGSLERQTPSQANLSNKRKTSENSTTPLGINNTSKRLADGIKGSSKKLKRNNEHVVNISDDSSDELNSKSLFIDKMLSDKKAKKPRLIEEQLTNSENSDGDSESSELDSAMEDYADNCIRNSDSSMSSEDSDEETNDSDDSSDDSLDESGSDTDSEGPYNLVFNDRMLTALRQKKLARNKTLIQMLPEGRLSLIAAIKGKLAELYNLHVDVRSTVGQLKRDCAEHNRTHSAGSLWSLQEGVKLLATYVLGTKRRGNGQALVHSLMQKLASLEASKEARVGSGVREHIANTLQGLFEVDESSLSTIVHHALNLVKRKGRGGNRGWRSEEPVLQSTPKHPDAGRGRLARLRAAPVKSRLYSSFDDRSATAAKKNNKNQSLTDRLSFPSTFKSFDEIEQFNDPSFLRKRKIGKFTRSPRSKKINSSRERKSPKIRNSFDDTREFPSPVGSRPKMSRRSSSKSPRTLMTKSPKRYFSKSPNTSVKSVGGKSSKSPKMKRNQNNRSQSRGKGSKSLRTKSKSPRRRK